MSIRTIHKQSSTTGPALINTPSDAGFIYDTNDGFIKYDDNGTARVVVNTAEAQTISGDKTFSGTTTFSGAVVNSAVDEIRKAEVAITNTEFLALRATPKALVAAPGAGFCNVFVQAIITNDYTAAYTESDDNLAIKYTDGSGAAATGTLECTGLVDATADWMGVFSQAVSTKPVANAALVLHNTGDGEFGGGNAANVLSVTIWYRVCAIP